jgi:tetratricopeptide (TPR) repeat protein
MPPSVFISYSHKDEVWKDRLVKHLEVLEKQNLLRTWDDRQIKAGDEWLEAIRTGMNGAGVAVFLVSADSLTSQFIRHTEAPHLLERRVRDGIIFIPVICKDCLWQEIPWLASLQARPRDGRALASFRGNRVDAELVKIAKEILNISRNGTTPGGRPDPVDPGGRAILASLHQLPSPPADFTGRQEDLSALKSALTGGGTGAIFGLRGMGGVGKTTLALKLTEELEPLYPDAQLYLDLKGVDPQPLTATQAMAHVVRSFHPDARAPEAEAEIAGLYRSILYGKRVLLLMDNAKDKGQVEPLIPPAGSLLLVTSRFHFTLPGLIVRDLDELPEEDARALLLRIAPRIGSSAGEIARLSGCLPLALRLAGSALAERLELSPTGYARRLKEGKERLDSVEASINLSYELLEENQRRLWRLLTVFPGTFDAQAAAAVWELEIDPATDALGDLVRSSLVERDDKDERYRLHDLARSFADRRLEESEGDVARRRHAEHFLGVLKTANDLYIGRDSVLQGLGLFDMEWANIQAGRLWAAMRFLKDAEAAKICSDYPIAGAFLLGLRLNPWDRILWRETALAAAGQRKDRDAEGRHLGHLGIAYRQVGDPRRAIKLYEQRLSIAREIGDRRGEGQTLGNLGLAHATLGEPQRAIELYEQALSIAREIGNRRGEGQALGNLGLSYANLGDPHRAMELHEQRLVIAREIGDRRGEGNAFGNLGLAFAKLGETQRAVEFYKKRLAIARELGDRQGECQALARLGNTYGALGDTRRAIEHYEQVLVITRKIGDRRSEAYTSWDLGEEIEKGGDLLRAANLMQLLVDYEREIGHPNTETHAACLAALRARIAEQNS